MLDIRANSDTVMAQVDFSLQRGLHLGAITESLVLSSRPLLQRSARLALTTVLACQTVLDRSCPIDYAETAIRGMQQPNHPLADFIPPHILRRLRDFQSKSSPTTTSGQALIRRGERCKNINESEKCPAGHGTKRKVGLQPASGTRCTRRQRQTEAEAAAQHMEQTRSLLGDGLACEWASSFT